MNLFSHFGRSEVYKKSWDDRGREVLENCNNFICDHEIILVYGCGPHRWLDKQINILYGAKVISSDIHCWDSSVIAIDLNRHFAPPEATLGILLGVVEFIENPLELFKALSLHHKSIIFSYTTLASSSHDVIAYENEMIYRVNSRFRNHYSMAEVLDVLTPYYYLSSCYRSTVFSGQIIFCADSLRWTGFSG